MEITIVDFISELSVYPALIITTVLTLGVIIVNGWTDAPNAIATCVSTRAMKPGSAILMAAVFNLFGVIAMTIVNQKVAETIYNMVDFRGNVNDALVALCAAMTAIVLWAVLAWIFGIPTSESHALIAGLSGAAIALQGGFSGINGSEWVKVLYGLVLSTVLGFVMGFVVVKFVELVCRGINRHKTSGFFEKAQIMSAAGMAFMHGAQDGQKFIGVFLLGMFLAKGQAQTGEVVIPIWLMVLCAAVMGIGTSIGGYRIIKSVGMDMVKLKKYQGFSSDFAGGMCLFLSTISGIPVSTTHVKTTAIMGVGAAKNIRDINLGIVREMVLTWVLTFPCCGLVGYMIAKLFLWFF
ncbi:inorganic phosphate transporter [Bacillus sp. DNRA2]|uniref:inorganic phosphate transporter n=1 Tax=Bacillus sp. DNRA2 TaxID=2723053 RepID=UPI00145E42F3|nr:inorganic phosphate transporter [Bacillus sp. DNRA2]NMD69798.1 inorganic phosphate transporter [Bacillus sp. DNRA2]